MGRKIIFKKVRLKKLFCKLRPTKYTLDFYICAEIKLPLNKIMSLNCIDPTIGYRTNKFKNHLLIIFQCFRQLLWDNDCKVHTEIYRCANKQKLIFWLIWNFQEKFQTTVRNLITSVLLRQKTLIPFKKLHPCSTVLHQEATHGKKISFEFVFTMRIKNFEFYFSWALPSNSCHDAGHQPFLVGF